MDVDEKPPSRIPDGVEVISLLDSDGDEMMVPVQPTPKPKPAVQPTPKPTGNAWGLLGKKKETAAQPTLTSASNANSSHTSAVTVISSDDADSDSPSEAKRIKKKTELYEEGYVCYGCGAVSSSFLSSFFVSRSSR
ncbi:hypothetical protein BDY24DRAFT_236410 [Mrakia frigida]|uniref:uncharacterized protein n=1 Tax=Mrakia frigida TaxID=29902 RepID=UPI003FCC2339